MSAYEHAAELSLLLYNVPFLRSTLVCPVYMHGNLPRLQCCLHLLQVVNAAEAFRVFFLRQRKGAPNESLLWMTASKSQPSLAMQKVMSGEAS